MIRILFAIFLCLPFLSYAQQTFAPVGAEWWYSGRYYDYIDPSGYDEHNPLPANYNWVTHVQSAGDTVIAGIACQHLVCTHKIRMATNPDSIRTGNGSVFVYDNTDTVFVYSDNAGRFIPLYIFNVSAGDTVCLSGLFSWFGDSTFCYVVDSIRMALYDTSHLKTYYTHTLMEHAYYSVNWGRAWWGGGNGPIHKGQYTEKLGGTMAVVSGLYPTLSTLYSDGNQTINDGPFYGTLRCYNDAAHAIKLTPLNCDFILHPGYLRIEDKKSLPSYISVYPNPVNERIMIASTKKLNADLDIRLFDITGKQIAHLKLGKTKQNISYDTHALPGGLYLLRLNMEDGAFYHKIVIRH